MFDRLYVVGLNANETWSKCLKGIVNVKVRIEFPRRLIVALDILI